MFDDWIDRFVMFSIGVAMWSLTAFVSLIIWAGLTGRLDEKESVPPPVPVESIPGGKEWKYEPIPAPYGDTFTFSPGIFNLGDN